MARFRRILGNDPEETTRHPNGSLLMRPFSLFIVALFVIAVAVLIAEVFTGWP